MAPHASIEQCTCLLDVGSQLGQGLGVGQDGTGRVAQEGHVPHAGQAQQHGDVALKGRLPEVPVNIMGPCGSTPLVQGSVP